MIQEKYNRRIYDEGTEEAILNFSHLRTNALEPVKISSSDNVLLFNPDSTSVVEWVQEKAKSAKVVEDLNDVKDSFDIIISLGSFTETPSVVRKHLSKEGKFVYAFSEASMDISFVKKLFKEAGFESVEVYRLKPNYLFTTEIFAEDYVQGGTGDYLLIAR